MTILLTATGVCVLVLVRGLKMLNVNPIGTKFVLLTTLAEPSAESMLQKVYEAYSDAVMKNPFHTPEMPIRSEGFDLRITTLIGSGQTV